MLFNMSLTITLSGHGSQLSSTFYPPIQLQEGRYRIALLRLSVYNSIPNVTKDNNCLEVNILSKPHKIAVPVGTYEIEEISEAIGEQIKLKSNLADDAKDLFHIEANTNTLQTNIFSKFPVSFNVNNSIAPLIGILKNTEIPEKGRITSEKIADINPVDVIRVECNIATGSFLNGQSSHTIYDFNPNVLSGYKITEVPKNLLYLPLVNTQSISDVTIKFVDQNQKLVNFRGERSSVVLAIEKYGA